MMYHFPAGSTSMGVNVGGLVLLLSARCLDWPSTFVERPLMWFIVPVVLASAPQVQAQTDVAAPGPRLVSVSDLDSSMVLDIRYATDNNFVGSPIDGYRESLCLLTPEAARALVRANAIVATQGYRIVVFDCYRPQRAVDHFVRWSYYVLDQKTKTAYYPNVDKRSLFDQGYIASKSGHSRGSTADVGLISDGLRVDRREPVMLDMGTPFDFFDPRSHTDAAGISAEQRHNRQILVDAMAQAGFRNYPKEWWHFTLIGEPHTDQYFDVVVARESAVDHRVGTAMD